MKYHIYFFLLFNTVSGISVYSQNSFVKWISSPGEDILVDIGIIEDNDKYIYSIIRGKFEGNPNTYTNYLFFHNKVYMTDQHLNPIDSIMIDIIEGHEVWIMEIVKSTSDSIVLAGSALDPVTFDFQICLIWLDENLNILKDTLYGLSDRSELLSNTILTSLGNVIFSGQIDPVLPSDKYVPTKNDFIGFLWEYDMSGTEIKTIVDTLGIPFGMLLELSESQKYHAISAGNICEFDNELNLDTIYDYSYPNFTTFGINQYVNDGYFIFGIYDVPSPPPWDCDMAFLHMNKEGSIVDMKHFGVIDTLDRYGDIDYVYDDTIFFGGVKNWKFEENNSWFSLYKTNVAGEVFSEKYFGGYGKYSMSNVLATSDGGCIMAGTWMDLSSQVVQNDIVIMKTDAHCTISGLEVDEKFNMTEILLYPNPFRDIIHLTTARDEKTELHIFDFLGKKVGEFKNIKDGCIDLSHLPKGIYIYLHKSGSIYIDKGKIIKQ